ncbi:hypothetical protein CSB69_0778 [Morganella morganii]|nr:hypothetical protein CSB69_0778 [Morganella morganii]
MIIAGTKKKQQRYNSVCINNVGYCTKSQAQKKRLHFSAFSGTVCSQ